MRAAGLNPDLQFQFYKVRLKDLNHIRVYYSVPKISIL